ncbi:MAG: dipeptidase [Fusicatenibacter sp.]
MFEVIDMHCDTIPGLQWETRKGEPKEIRKSTMQIDLEKLKQGGYLCQCFSLFTHLGSLKELGETPYEHVMKLARFWQEEIGRYPEQICQVRSYEELKNAQSNGKIGALMSVEEGAVYEGSLEKLGDLYEMGVRMSSITWNYPNELGYPNPPQVPGEPYCYDTEQGLTETGISFLEEMERLGILIDISHLNDAGIRDVFAHTTGPVLASHSDARGVCGHARNLSDEMIRELAIRGGVTGINFCPAFLRDQKNPVKREKAMISDMIRHMKYLRNIGGIEVIGLGTDFDGFGGEVEIMDAGGMQKLADAMSINGFTDGEIEKVFSGNVLRVFREVLR